MTMENYELSNTKSFVHDESFDQPSLAEESKKELRRFIDEAELTPDQQQKLRQVSAHYAVRTAPVPEENIGMRDRCLKEAIIQSDLSVYDAQAIENRGVSFGIAEDSKAVVYVNDSPLTQDQLEGAYQYISISDQTDLEAVRIAFESKQTEVLEEAFSAPAYEDDRHLAEMQSAIQPLHTMKEELNLKPITAQITAQAVKITKKIFEIVGAR